MTKYQILQDTILEGPRSLKVVGKGDVIVAGGGPTGLAAAIAAAREGAQVWLVETMSFLGGVATGSMMAALVASHWATGISLELIDRLAARGGAVKWDPTEKRTATTPFDPEEFKSVSLEMVLEAGVNLLLYTSVVAPILIDGVAKGVIIESKSGRQALLGHTIIDCTGDADLAVRAGAPYVVGRESDNLMRPFALLFRLGGLDIEAIMEYADSHPEDIQPQYRKGTRLLAGNERVISRVSGFYDLVEQAKAEGHLYPECHYFRLENLWVDRGTAICNTTRVYYVDGTDAKDLTKGELEARKQIQKLVEFARKYIPGCENAFVIDVAPRIGVRETRRIVGEYVLADEDAYRDARFDDAFMTIKGSLVKRPVPIELDVHMPDPIEGSEKDLLERYPERVPREPHEYQIPFRTMLPKGVDNLIVAGRTISVSHMIDGSTRNMLACMRMGQVAGTAAAISAMNRISPKIMNFEEVKAALIEQGVSGL